MWTKSGLERRMTPEEVKTEIDRMLISCGFSEKMEEVLNTSKKAIDYMIVHKVREYIDYESAYCPSCRYTIHKGEEYCKYCRKLVKW